MIQFSSNDLRSNFNFQNNAWCTLCLSVLIWQQIYQVDPCLAVSICFWNTDLDLGIRVHFCNKRALYLWWATLILVFGDLLTFSVLHLFIGKSLGSSFDLGGGKSQNILSPTLILTIHGETHQFWSLVRQLHHFVPLFILGISLIFFCFFEDNKHVSAIFSSSLILVNSFHLHHTIFWSATLESDISWSDNHNWYLSNWIFL